MREEGESARSFHNIPYFQHCSCCDGIRERSRQLVGELILPNKAGHAQLSIYPQDQDLPGQEINVLTFLASNTLTESTAFGLLHLLHHFRDTAFGLSCIRRLNERVVDMLSIETNVQAVLPYRFKFEELFVCELPTVVQLEEMSRQARFKRLHAAEMLQDLETKLGDALQLCLGVGQVCRELSFVVGNKPETCIVAVNSIIKVGLELGGPEFH